MKKLISLLLVVILVCSALAGCDWNSIFNQNKNADDMTSTTTTTTTTITTTKPKPQIVPTFEYGDNLTNEDFYFITECAEYLWGYPRFEYDNISDKVDYIQRHNYNTTFYKISVDIRAPMHYICAYINKDFFETSTFPPPFDTEYGYEIEYFVWHKFEYGEDVPDEIDNCVFVGAFAIFGGIVEKDIVNNKEYNYDCRYIVSLKDGMDDINVDISSKYKLSKDFLYFYSVNLEGKYIYIEDYNYQSLYHEELSTLYMDSNGEPYCLLESFNNYNSDTFAFENYRDSIGSFFDEMLPYLVVRERNDWYEGYCICISLEHFAEVCK